MVSHFISFQNVWSFTSFHFKMYGLSLHFTSLHFISKSKVRSDEHTNNTGCHSKSFIYCTSLMEPLHTMSPLSERGKPLLWRHQRLHRMKSSPRHLRSGCLKVEYICQIPECWGSVTLTEKAPDTNEFYEEGTLFI